MLHGTTRRLWALLITAAAGFASGSAPAAAKPATVNPSFAGTWELAPDKSTNLGMLAATRVTLVIVQTSNAVAIRETSVFQGKSSLRAVGYDLTGRPVTNQGPMGGANQTVAHWEDGKLVVHWTGEGAIPGTKVERTETRSLSADGRTMSVEMVRGEGPAVTMVFERRK